MLFCSNVGTDIEECLVDFKFFRRKTARTIGSQGAAGKRTKNGGVPNIQQME
jgi:hypothetical protein